MDLRRGPVPCVGRGALAADRQYRGSRDRCGHRGCGRYARALLPSRERPALAHAGEGVAAVRTRALAGQSGAYRTGTIALEAARVPGFRGAAFEGAAGAIVAASFLATPGTPARAAGTRARGATGQARVAAGRA